MKFKLPELLLLIILISLTSSMYSQNFDSIFKMVNESEKNAIESLKNKGFNENDLKKKGDYALKILTTKETAIHLNYKISTGIIESVEIYIRDKNKIDALIDEIRNKKNFQEEFDLVGEYSSIIFKDSNNNIVSIINGIESSNYYLSVSKGIHLYESTKEYMESKFPFDKERIKVLKSTLKFVQLRNSNSKTIEELIQKNIGTNIKIGNDIDTFLDDFESIKEYEQIEEIVRVSFLKDDVYRKKAEKVVNEIIPIMEVSDFDDEIMEMDLYQVLIDRNFKITLGMLNMLFEELEY